MKILFAGTPEPAAMTLRYLLEESPHEVVAVLTQPDARRGRGRSLHPSAVAEVAEKAGLPVHKWTSLKSTAADAGEIRATLGGYAEAGVEAVAVVAYGQILPADILGIFPAGWINLHFSLLPRWRGAAPVQAAIAAGDQVTGATTFRIVPGLDAGPLIDSAAEKIGVTDTTDDVLTRLTITGRVLLSQSLTGLETGSAIPVEQDAEGMTYAPKITADQAQIDWRRSAAEIQRVSRAHTPNPGAWTTLDGQRYKIGLLLPTDADSEGEGKNPGENRGENQGENPGPGVLLAEKTRVLVGTGDTALIIDRIQPPGKKMMAAADWARGRADISSSGSNTRAFDAITSSDEGEN